MTIYDFLPKFINRIIADRPRQTVTNEYWNELFNLLIEQGDHGQEAIRAITEQLTSNVLFKDNEETWEPLNDYQPATVKFVTDRIEFMGGGDMMKASYDINEDGVVMILKGLVDSFQLFMLQQTISTQIKQTWLKARFH